MTKKQAIEQLESILEYTKYQIAGDDRGDTWKEDRDALEWAIRILSEEG